MKTIHPELDIEQHPQGIRGISSRSWDGFFWSKFNTTTSPTLAEVEATPFMPGSYVYHWHNRYNEGLPKRSWAGVLSERFQRMAQEKAPVCAK